METPFEYFKNFSSLNLYENKEKQNLKDSYLNKIINNNPNINTKFTKDSFNLLKDERIKIGRFKLPPNIKINDKFKEDFDINKISDEKKINKKELTKNNSNNLNSLSEIKKFKTELCHSWELSGTCKYGLNVSLNKIY